MGVFTIPNFFLIVLLFCCEIIGSKKISPKDLSNIKLSECRRCKILTESFNHWLDETSRGKYEGGDAAWEEAKLKSYSRSEIRLVEIQEGLCSELKKHQDSCYALAEEAEQVIENWWFNEDPNAADLYTWLCIENLQHCCPIGHFGDVCSPCIKDKDNNICSGHGRCDGDGTRKGNGTCLCKKGFSGTSCDECSKNYYFTEVGSCEKCHKSCNECSNQGADACDTCNIGWQSELGTCVDINECSTSVCQPNEFCTNTEGSFICKKCDLSCKTCMGEGPSDCMSCDSPNILWFGTCIDAELKQNIITNTFKRLILYIGLLFITLFIFHMSKSIASIVVLLIAIFIYFSEYNLRMSTADVLQYLLLSSN